MFPYSGRRNESDKRNVKRKIDGKLHDQNNNYSVHKCPRAWFHVVYSFGSGVT